MVNHDVILEAVVRASIAEGTKLLSGVAKAAWGKLRGLIGNWAGDKSTKIEQAIGSVIDEPSSAAEVRVLTERLQKVGAPVSAEIIDAARQLIAQLDSDPGTAATKASFQQVMGNLTNSFAIQAAGGSSVTVQDQKKTPQ